MPWIFWAAFTLMMGQACRQAHRLFCCWGLTLNFGRISPPSPNGAMGPPTQWIAGRAA